MSEETIFHEVTEELRRDRLHKSWRRFGPYLIGVAVLVVLVVAGNEGWKWYQSNSSSRSSDDLYQAFDLETGGDLAGAQKVLDQIIAQGSGQYPLIAKFRQAGLLAKQNASDQALAAYDALATSVGDPRLKGLALLLGANILVDKGDVPGVKSRIEGLLAPTDPLHTSAEETLGLAQYKAGDLNGALNTFEQVMNDPNAPQPTVGRMRLYAAQLVAQGATPPAAAGADAASQGNPPASSAAPATAKGAAKPNAGSPAPAANSAPAGVESSQPATPDPALDLATPTAPAPAQPGAPELSTGAGQPVPDAGTTAPAASPTPAASPKPAPAAPAAPTQPAPSAGTTGK
ncbi:MAG TPA: tetratricopeptide repeat protein [Devosiaceae bacterium]|jgi:hypothetical protein|nr:tetratricopeptide repeat protein [Devosiaceae bacterium]